MDSSVSRRTDRTGNLKEKLPPLTPRWWGRWVWPIPASATPRPSKTQQPTGRYLRSHGLDRESEGGGVGDGRDGVIAAMLGASWTDPCTSSFVDPCRI